MESTYNPLIYIFLYSRHLCTCYCKDIARRNSILVIRGVKGLGLVKILGFYPITR